MRYRALLLAAALTALPHEGAAAPHNAVPELVTESASFSTGRPVTLALRFAMAPGWHIYWRNPGDSGTPPSVKWTLPPGVTAGPFAWPTPKKIDMPPLSNLGYEGEAALLAELEVPASYSGSRLRIDAEVDWLECLEECLPGSAKLSLVLPRGDGAPDLARAEFFSAARFALPAELPGLDGAAYASAERVRLALRPPGWPDGPAAPLFFPEDPSVIESVTDGLAGRGGEGWVMDYPAGPRAAAAAGKERLKGVLYSSEGWRGPGSETGLAVDIPLRGWAGAPPPPGAAGAGLGLFAALVFAFIGGLLLNLMPCVLPVLSIKVLALINQSKDSPGEARAHGLAYGAGVVLSFWALAGLLLAIKAGGAQWGWGFQLQSPAFVAFLAAVFFVLGLSMAGVFEIGTSLIGLGRFAARPGPTGAFLGGVLAVVAATPCTAPFMGAALGFALTQPAYVSLAVFTSMAIGLASPFLAVSFSPALMRYMPRPGDWMTVFKQGMSFLLFATVVWLLWVLGRQAGAGAMSVLTAALLAMAAGGWILGRWGGPERPPAVRRAAAAAAALLMAGSAGWAVWTVKDASAPAPAAAEAAGIKWEPYSAAALDGYRREGRPVFLDFTADWCLTCQVNERAALRDAAVLERFGRYGVAALKADWTRRDPEITRALAAHGRSGVPLYVLYAPGREPRLLPALLTPGIVLEALDSEFGNGSQGGKP